MSDLSPTFYHCIGIDPATMEATFDISDFPEDRAFEEVGSNGTYLVLLGSNDEQLFLFTEEADGFTEEADGPPELLSIDPVFAKGSWFTLRLETAVDLEAPDCYIKSHLVFDVLDGGEPCTRLSALIVNKPNYILGTERSWYGRKREVQYDMTSAYGTQWRAKLSVFAQSITHFETEQAFFDSQPSADLDDEEPLIYDGEEFSFRMASTSFVPYGLVPPEIGEASPVASGTGPVKSAGTAQSSFGGPDYNWAVVGMLGGLIGVAWSPQTAPAAKVGSFLSYDGMVVGAMASREELEEIAKTEA